MYTVKQEGDTVVVIDSVWESRHLVIRLNDEIENNKIVKRRKVAMSSTLSGSFEEAESLAKAYAAAFALAREVLIET